MVIVLNLQCSFIQSNVSRTLLLYIKCSYFVPKFFKDGDPLGQFSVTVVGQECRLTSRGSLDREMKDKHTLKLIATDGKFQTAASLEVHVLDSNDNSPLCEQVSCALLLKNYFNFKLS